MLETTSPPPGSPADAITRLFKLELDARALSVRSGISEVTLRQIVATGRVNSYVTAIGLEMATDRQIDADAITTLVTKGAQLYRREPARSLLLLSFEQGVDRKSTRLNSSH